MYIGNVLIKNGLFLAPMAGYTDSAFRVLCHWQGADATVTEMISAKALHFGDQKTLRLAEITKDEGVVGLQIFGHEPEIMAEAAHYFCEGDYPGTRPAFIDINMGCPVHKITQNGEGSALMQRPNLIRQIVKAVSNSTSTPVTVKMRLGLDDAHKNVLEIASICEEEGAKCIFIHGRTKVAMYSGEANYSLIKEAKQKLTIPVVGNGDITSTSKAKSLLEETGCDGIMIGRGAIGNPFLFQELACLLEDRTYIPPSLEERIDMAILHIHMSAKNLGENTAVKELKKQLLGYIQNIYGAARYRMQLATSNSIQEMETILKEIKKLP